MIKFIFVTGLLLICCCTVTALPQQNETIESVTEALKRADKKLTHASLLCQLALLYVYKPGEIPNDLDSALLLARQAEIINASLKDKLTEAKICFVRSNAFREKADTARGHDAINKALKIYTTTPARQENGDAYIELSRYFSITTKDGCLKMKDCYEKAVAQFQAAGVKEKQADALKNLGDFNQLLRNYGLAMINLRGALAIYNSIGYKNKQGVYDLLGIVSSNMGDFSNAIQYGLLAVQAAENINDTSMQLCTIYHRLAVAYGYWAKWEEADNYETKALAVAIKYRNKDAIETVLLSIAYMQKGRSVWQKALAQIKSADQYTRPWNLEDSVYMSVIYETTYLNGKDFKTASKYADYLIHIIPRITSDQFAIHTIYPCLAGYYLAIKKFTTARKYIEADLVYSTRYANKRTISIDYLLASKADSGLHQFEQALKHYQVYKTMSDSMLNETKSFQLAQMQVAYETDKKDKDLKIKQQDIEVITNKNKLQELNLKKANFTRNIIILAALALISILVAGYKIKQRHNSKLELQQKEINSQNAILKQVLSDQQKLVTEKEWLVKEIHHRVKNNLQMIISLLNAQSEFLEHPSAIKAIKESRERMQAISLIHQKLYQPDQGTLIDMGCYIRELVGYLYSFSDIGKIKLVLEVENIELDVSQSVPLGLILNEAITNVVKYAFPNDEKGKVVIEFRHVNDTHILLRISDNGKGFPANAGLEESNSLGIQLIKLFADQLEGELQIKGENGVEISVIFQQQYPKNERHLMAIG